MDAPRQIRWWQRVICPAKNLLEEDDTCLPEIGE
jgi:hypothetical protein